MKQSTVVLMVMVLTSLFALGCSGGGGNPVSIDTEPTYTGSSEIPGGQANTHLWGYYDIYIDPENNTVEISENRSAMFTANVLNFINGNPAGLNFNINETLVESGYVDVDIDVTINHPFPGMPEYNGYDVRGIFMGDGSGALSTGGLTYPVNGPDQMLFADPDDGYGGPDGYSRWFNFTEFSTGGMPMFQYTQGSLATPGFDGTATLCPYLYFADGLGTTEDLWTWLGTYADQHGVFSAGASNTRNYYLRFPDSTGVAFGYAILANWLNEAPEFHPSNASEAIACDLVDNSTVFYIDPGSNGGDINLDISLWDWDSTVSAGVMDDYGIIIETSALSSPYEFTPADMTPTGGDSSYSTYHVEIEADNVTATGETDLWVIVECDTETYENDFGVINLAGDDPLTAYFRYQLTVSDTPSNFDPVCDLVVSTETPMPIEDFIPVTVTLDATGSYDPDGDPLTFEWDFDGDLIYDEDPDDSYEGDPDNPTHYYTATFNDDVSLRLTDGNGGETVCSVAVDVTAHQSKNIALRSGIQANDLGVDPSNGDLWIVYDDRQAWLYTLNGWYADGTYRYQCMWSNAVVKFMDVTSGGYAMYMGIGSSGYANELYVRDNNGNVTYGTGIGSGSGPPFFQDCTNYGTTGTYANDLAMYMGLDNWGMNYYNYYMWEFASPYTSATFRVSGNMPYSPVTGYNRVFHEYVQGMDTGIEGTDFWFLEAPDYYCAAFHKTAYASWYHLTYSNSYFGAGSEQTGDTGWTVDVCDLARDSDGRFHVLDLVSSQGIIKVFTGSPTGGTSIGHYGDSASISSTPLKIDGCDYDGKMFIIHGNPTDGYFLSIFMPSELP